MLEPTKTGDTAIIIFDALVDYGYYKNLIEMNQNLVVKVIAYRGDAYLNGRLYRMFRVHGDFKSEKSRGPVSSLIIPGAWLETVNST